MCAHFWHTVQQIMSSCCAYSTSPLSKYIGCPFLCVRRWPQMSCPKGWIFDALLFDAWQGCSIWVPDLVVVRLLPFLSLVCLWTFIWALLSLLFCTYSVLACLDSSRNALYGLLVKITVLPRHTFECLFDLDLAFGGGKITNGKKTR